MNPENKSPSDLVPTGSHGQGQSEGQLEYDERHPDLSTETEDDYDRIGNVPAADEDDSDPYSHWSTLTPTSKPPENSGLNGLVTLSGKRILIVGTVLLILLLTGGLVTTTTLLSIERNRPLVSLPHTHEPTPVPPDTSAVNRSMSDLSTSQGTTMPTETMMPTISTEPKSTMKLVTSAVPKQTPTTDIVISASVTIGDETPSLTSSTTTVAAPTSTDFSTTTASPCSDNRTCHACTSVDYRCPRNGSMGNTEMYGMVEKCSCPIACFSEVKDGDVVRRGCVQGKGSIWQEKSKSLNCQQIGTSYVCFCLGHKCNEHNMTQYISLG